MRQSKQQKKNGKVKNSVPLTNTQRQQRFQDRAASIDSEMDEARKNIDWKRRKEAERSLADWICTYGIGVFIDDEPSEKCRDILNTMEHAITDHKNYLLAIARGTGKSCYSVASAMYALATGKRSYVLIVSANARAAQNLMQDAYRIVTASDAFIQDYPDLALPMVIANGSFRRRQMYKGKATGISKTASQIVFAEYWDDGKCSGGQVLEAAGISSGIRGKKHFSKRVDMCILDDLQTAEDASNPATVEKILGIIRKDIMNLGGKNKMSILNLATPIEPDDMVEKLKNDKHWLTTIYPAIISYPDDIRNGGGLWQEYFRLYDEELVDDTPHERSLEYYRTHQKDMDEGSAVLSDRRYSTSDGHISAIQKLLLIEREIGDAFQTEYQMKPKKHQAALAIVPAIVQNRINEYPENHVPEGFHLVCAATDINSSYALTTVVVAFKPDMSTVVLSHMIEPLKIDQSLNDTLYNQAVYDALVAHGKKLAQLGIKMSWVIDGGGRNFHAVCDFSKQSAALTTLRACCMLGRSAIQFNPFVRSKLRGAINDTVLCGDEAEHIKAGAGRKYIFFNSDAYKERVQRAFLTNVGSAGSCSLYDANKGEHTEFSIQLCNEKLQGKQKRGDGREQHYWKSFEPHDYLDAMAMAFGCAGNQGISNATVPSRGAVVQRLVQRKRRVRII